MEKGLFIGHGNSAVNWHKDLLVIKFNGPFNLEGVLNCSQEIKEAVEETKHAKWARVELEVNQDVMVPVEAFEYVKDNLEHSKKHGCVLIVSVGANLLSREKMTEICHQCGLDYRVAQSFDDAVDYAQKQLNITNSLSLTGPTIQK